VLGGRRGLRCMTLFELLMLESKRSSHLRPVQRNEKLDELKTRQEMGRKAEIHGE